MDIMNVVSIFWNKLNKPITNILAGIFIYFYAPNDWKLVSGLFFVFALSTILEWLYNKLCKYIDIVLNKNKIKKEISILNNDEIIFLKMMIKNKEKTGYVNYRDYIGIDSLEYNDYIKKILICTGLSHKKIITATNVGEHLTITINDIAWKLLNKDYK